ncbi:hypothetical protein [Zunongwangia sp. HGR-M22]|uniref:hypothetical protein n=1 Tax=Zunongwangia sp. HGR-M22 TaxID=3015168 RepID=UPI0022DD93F2|nr:hypothetical protein [Zunongwangia sp. HGR-M22]WBL27101.1 hypothetical protein PBT91_07465 [Zunongwangia sp. HGR-M22]
MDGLELLKKDWKNQEVNLPKVSYDDLYKMIWKRSSSIVKWLFVISLCEFVLGIALNFFVMDDNYWKNLDKVDLREFTIALNGINLIIWLFFVYKFYKNYQRISSTSSTKKLMQNILKTRKTVKHYIGYMLISSAFVIVMYSFLIFYHYLHETHIENNPIKDFDTIDYFKFIGIIIIVLSIVLGGIWLFYRLIYGILLRRLKKNYTQLKNLDCD